MLQRRIGIVVAIVALCVAVTGWISETEAAASPQKQLRYYGGPKSPMWRGQ